MTHREQTQRKHPKPHPSQNQQPTRLKRQQTLLKYPRATNLQRRRAMIMTTKLQQQLRRQRLQMVRNSINKAEINHKLRFVKATATEDDATATATKREADNNATDTATITATSSSAPTSTAAVTDINLNNATIGENAELVKVDGKPTM
jgi:hypothetical protein